MHSLMIYKGIFPCFLLLTDISLNFFFINFYQFPELSVGKSSHFFKNPNSFLYLIDNVVFKTTVNPLTFKRIAFNYYSHLIPFNKYFNYRHELQLLESTFRSSLSATLTKSPALPFFFSCPDVVAKLQEQLSKVFTYDYNPLEKMEMLSEIISDLIRALESFMMSETGADERSPLITHFLASSQFHKQFSSFFYMTDFLKGITLDLPCTLR